MVFHMVMVIQYFQLVLFRKGKHFLLYYIFIQVWLLVILQMFHQNHLEKDT